MHTEYSNLALEKLMEILTLHTAKLTHLLLQKNVYCHDYEECKDEIHKLTDEIGKRKKIGAYTSYYPFAEQNAIKD